MVGQKGGEGEVLAIGKHDGVAACHGLGHEVEVQVLEGVQADIGLRAERVLHEGGHGLDLQAVTVDEVGHALNVLNDRLVSGEGEVGDGLRFVHGVWIWDGGGVARGLSRRWCGRRIRPCR